MDLLCTRETKAIQSLWHQQHVVNQALVWSPGGAADGNMASVESLHKAGICLTAWGRVLMRPVGVMGGAVLCAAPLMAAWVYQREAGWGRTGLMGSQSHPVPPHYIYMKMRRGQCSLIKFIYFLDIPLSLTTDFQPNLFYTNCNFLI